MKDVVEVRTILETPSLVVGTWQQVMFARWRGAPEVDAVRTLRRVAATYVAGVPKFAGFNFVDATSVTKFDDKVREEVAAMRRDNAAKQVAIATVIEGTGFWASTVRSIASGLALVQREPFPSKNFPDREQGVQWIVPIIGADLAALSEAARAFRGV